MGLKRTSKLPIIRESFLQKKKKLKPNHKFTDTTKINSRQTTNNNNTDPSVRDIVLHSYPSDALPNRPHKVLLPNQLVTTLASEGARRSKESIGNLLQSSIFAGSFVALGGMLCSSIGGDYYTNDSRDSSFWLPGNGQARFLFGAIGFPLSILLVTLTGSFAFTGNLALAGAAISTKKIKWYNTIPMLVTTYIGCFFGTSFGGLFVALAKIPSLHPCYRITLHKLSLSPLQVFLRGIGGGYLIAMAITLGAGTLKGGGGLSDIAFAIWFPISTYVMLDFEHCLANMFFFSAAFFYSRDLGVDYQLRIRDLVCSLFFSTAGNVVGSMGLAGFLLSKSMNKNVVSKKN